MVELLVDGQGVDVFVLQYVSDLGGNSWMNEIARKIIN